MSIDQTSQAPFMQTEFKMALHAMLEQAINRGMQLDPDYRAKITPLAGKTFTLELTDIDQTLYFYFTETDVMLRSEASAADVHLTGSLFDMLKQARQANAGITGKFRIQGDIASAQQFQQFIQSLNLDWEETLSRYTGDVAAHKISQLARGVFGWAQQAHESTLNNIAEYLQAESEINPDKAEAQQFSDAVNTLRDDAARLQQRINRLKQQI